MSKTRVRLLPLFSWLSFAGLVGVVIKANLDDAQYERATGDDVAVIAHFAVEDSAFGKAARRRLIDLRSPDAGPNGPSPPRDLSPALPVIRAALADADPATRHRAVEAVGEVAYEEVRVARREPTPWPTPFWIDLAPEFAQVAAVGDIESRAKTLLWLPYVAVMICRAGGDASAIEHVVQAAHTDPDPKIRIAAEHATGLWAHACRAGLAPKCTLRGR